MEKIEKFREIYTELEIGSSHNLDFTSLKILDEKNISKLGNSFLYIAYTFSEIVIGRIDGNKLQRTELFNLQTDLIMEMRMFSKKGEIYIWKTDKGFSWRLVIDNEKNEQGKLTNTYDEIHYIWGKADKAHRKYLTDENRGIKIILPVELTGEQAVYHIRNYFNYTEDGLIKFYDSRLVNITDRENGLIGMV